MRFPSLAAVAFAIGASLLAVAPDAARTAAGQKKARSGPEEALAQVKLADAGLKAAVWAAEPLMANPVSFCFDEKGRAFVAETTRFENGVPDTRGHMKWLDEDLANRSIDDLLAMYKKHKYQGFEKYDDQVRLVWDSTVRAVTSRSSAMRSFEWPSATSASTSRSLAVRRCIASSSRGAAKIFWTTSGSIAVPPSATRRMASTSSVGFSTRSLSRYPTPL